MRRHIGLGVLLCLAAAGCGKDEEGPDIRKTPPVPPKSDTAQPPGPAPAGPGAKPPGPNAPRPDAPGSAW